MKKVIITTFCKAHNYGAVLQTYALQKVVSDLGNSCEILNYNDICIDKNYKVLNFTNIKNSIKSIVFFNKNLKRSIAFNNFINKKLKLTSKEYNSPVDIINNYPKADVYITGSDQVWNPQITNGLSDIYTLNFGESESQRISYAASIGKDKILSSDIKKYEAKLSTINCISLREKTAKAILQPLCKNLIEVVLDPTLLLDKSEWDSEIANFPNEKEKYILAYIVEKDDEMVKIVNSLSKMTNLKVIHFEKINKYKRTLKSCYTSGPLEFVNLIKNAEYIICTSFHATVFSIIYNKKFWVVPHKTTGSRVTDLLNDLGISDRAVNNIAEFSVKNYDSEIDYNKVNNILEEKRHKSIKWLENAINNRR